MKIIYLRVSREDLDESDQLPQIVNHFKLKESECLILRERISAYSEKEQIKRSEFIKLKEWVEEGKVTDIYVYSLERIERNIIRTFEFFFFCEANNCRIHGVLQPSLELDFDDSPIGTFSRYNQVLIYGLLGENESYMISKRTSKAVVQGDITTSSYGHKWGDKYRNLKGERVDVPLDTIRKMHRRIEFLLSKKLLGKEIKEDIAKRFELDISLMTISRVKHNKNTKQL